MPIGRMIAIVFLLFCSLLAAELTFPGQAAEITRVKDAPQAGDTTTKDKVGQILGDLLILSLYGFPLSIAEGWAVAGPKKAKKQPKTGLSESLEVVETSGKPAPAIGDEAPASSDARTIPFGPRADWERKVLGVPGVLVAGGCLTAVVVVAGGVAFALYYHFSGQPEMVSQILPRFAYWLPFGLLGLITDVPFQVFDWEDRRLGVFLRLILWWFPRFVIFAFVFNPPILQNLDPATTALAVLAIDGVLAAFFLWLHTSREQIP